MGVTSVLQIKPVMFLVVCHLVGVMSPRPFPCLPLQMLFLMLYPTSWAVAGGHPMIGDPLQVPPFSAQRHHLRPWAKGFSRSFFLLVPTPLEQPGRRVHPTFQMLMKVFQKVNGGQRPKD